MLGGLVRKSRIGTPKNYLPASAFFLGRLERLRRRETARRPTRRRETVPTKHCWYTTSVKKKFLLTGSTREPVKKSKTGRVVSFNVWAREKKIRSQQDHCTFHMLPGRRRRRTGRLCRRDRRRTGTRFSYRSGGGDGRVYGSVPLLSGGAIRTWRGGKRAVGDGPAKNRKWRTRPVGSAAGPYRRSRQ